MRPFSSASATLAVAAAVGLATALAPSAHAASPGANHQPQPVSIVHYNDGGLHITVLKYSPGVRPSAISPGPCSVESSVGFGVEDNGEYEVYCYDGHGQKQIDLYNVETAFAYQDTSAELDVDGHNRQTCTAVNYLSQYQEIVYSPLAHVCWLEM